MTNYLEAKWMGAVRGQPTLLVVHSMEAPEKGTTAEETAMFFHNGSGGKKTSAHRCLDNNSIVDCVPWNRVAYAAPGANNNGYHYELAGYAKQTKLDWADDFSRAMLLMAASEMANDCMRWNIWPVARRAADLKRGLTNGITMHREVSVAYHQSTHTDPGPGFPFDDYCKLVASIVQQRQNPHSPATPPLPPPAVQQQLAQLQQAIFFTKIDAGKTAYHKGDGAANGRAPGTKIIQQGLINKGAQLVVSGEFDQHMEDVVKWIQTVQAWPVTGAVDTMFMNWLFP